MTTVIKQIVGDNSQTIRQVVQENERGPQGPQGEPGIPGGTIQYSAGTGIEISDENVISATGVTSVAWGAITGTLDDQTDLKNALALKANASSLATVATTGSYNDLINKPTIPTVNNATLTITKNGVSAGTFTANQAVDTTIALTDTTYSDFTGTTGAVDGAAGLVPAPATTDAGKFLGANGSWTTLNTNYSTTEALTGATWIDGSPIYKKTIDFGALPNATSKQVAHGITNLYRVIEIVGWAYRPGDSSTFPLPATSTSATGAITVTITAADVVIASGTDRSNLTESYVTVYYTKSA